MRRSYIPVPWNLDLVCKHVNSLDRKTAIRRPSKEGGY